MSDTAIQVAKIGALATIGAALLAGLFLFFQPIASDYWNRTSEIRIADVSFALMSDRPAVDIVISNPTKATQAIVSIEVSLSQEGLPLMMIAKSTYQLSGELEIDRRSGAVQGFVQGEDRSRYPFDGWFVHHARGDWLIHLTIPVRERLAPEDSRSIVFVVPNAIEVLTKGDGLNNWLPGKHPEGWGDIYFSGAEKDEFRIWDFLNGRGPTNIRIRVRRGDGRTALYDGSITCCPTGKPK